MTARDCTTARHGHRRALPCLPGSAGDPTDPPTVSSGFIPAHPLFPRPAPLTPVPRQHLGELVVPGLGFRYVVFLQRTLHHAGGFVLTCQLRERGEGGSPVPVGSWQHPSSPPAAPLTRILRYRFPWSLSRLTRMTRYPEACCWPAARALRPLLSSRVKDCGPGRSALQGSCGQRRAARRRSRGC